MNKTDVNYSCVGYFKYYDYFYLTFDGSYTNYIPGHAQNQ